MFAHCVIQSPHRELSVQYRLHKGTASKGYGVGGGGAQGPHRMQKHPETSNGGKLKGQKGRDMQSPETKPHRCCPLGAGMMENATT